jgi:hypothetical protein
MARRTQKNRYELTMQNGTKRTVIANSYNGAISACRTFCVPAVQVQRINANGKRKIIKNV